MAEVVTVDSLQARDIAAAIRETLSGARSKLGLSNWAFNAWLDDDTGRRSFASPQRDEIDEALHELWYMDGVPEMELSDDELRALMEHLENLPLGG